MALVTIQLDTEKDLDPATLGLLKSFIPHDDPDTLTMQEVIYFRTREKIKGMKSLRGRTGLSLKEVKDIAEAVEDLP